MERAGNILVFCQKLVERAYGIVRIFNLKLDVFFFQDFFDEIRDANVARFRSCQSSFVEKKQFRIFWAYENMNVSRRMCQAEDYFTTKSPKYGRFMVLTMDFTSRFFFAP